MSESVTSSLLYISVLDEDEMGYRHLQLNAGNFFKFYTNKNTITYSPSEITYKFVEFKNGSERSVVGAKVRITVKGYNRSNTQATEQIIYTEELNQVNMQSTENYEYKYPFPLVINNSQQLIDITSIILETFIEKNANSGYERVGYEEISVMYGTTNDMAKFTLAASGITMAVQEAGLLFDANGLTIQNGNFTIKNEEGKAVFTADNEGNLYFSGTVDSKLGNLSGWNLTDYDIIDAEEKVGLHSGTIRRYEGNTSPVRFWAGVLEESTALLDDGEEEFNYKKYNFAVTAEGTLYANNANISGNIEAREGRILGQFFVGPNNNAGIIISGAENSSFIGSMQYASGALGSGWKISSDGSAEFNNVSIRGKISSSVFEYNHISAVGGSLYIAPTLYTQKVSSKVTKNSGKYYVTWDLDILIEKAFGSRPLNIGDYLLLDGGLITNGTLVHISNVQAVVTALPTKQSFTVEFNYENVNLTGAYFEPGTTVIFYGTSGSRDGLYLTAIDSTAPYLDVYSYTQGSKEDNIPAVRLGNLAGITDANFAISDGINDKEASTLSGYGLYSNNAYLRGQLMLPNAGITNQTDKIGEDGSPIRIWAGLPAGQTRDIGNAYFYVTEQGSLYAEKGHFKGIVEATNSEFSGSIRAAGILLETVDKNPTDALHDHFYVAYNILDTNETEFTPSYKNYVLNIDGEGLSIWEGGLQAYSDVANDTPGNIYSAYCQTDTNVALPYLYLVDKVIPNETELNARIVVNKLHSVNFIPQVDAASSQAYCSVTSTQINNGLWFVSESISIGDDGYKGMEQTLFTKPKLSGLTLENTKLALKNNIVDGYIDINAPSGVQINMENFDTSNYFNNTLMVGGNIQLATLSSNKAEFKINSSVIQEAKDSTGRTIGMNFIAVS